jgi:hypothetical protein
MLKVKAALLVLVCFGCTNTFIFNNQPFSSADAALNAHRQHLKNVEAELKPVETPYGGSAALITPSKRACKALGVTRMGRPDNEIIEYLALYLEQEFSFYFRYLLKSNIFSSVDHFIVDFPRLHINEVYGCYSVIIFLDMKSPSQQAWYMIVPAEETPSQIQMDVMLEGGAPRVQSWIYAIRRALEEVDK